jgi:AraC-like DNA-binding protein
MAAHAAQPLSLADVCGEVGCGARALQQAFRQHVGQGPMEFLRELRLDRVREELKASARGADGGARGGAEVWVSAPGALRGAIPRTLRRAAVGDTRGALTEAARQSARQLHNAMFAQCGSSHRGSGTRPVHPRLLDPRSCLTGHGQLPVDDAHSPRAARVRMATSGECAAVGAAKVTPFVAQGSEAGALARWPTYAAAGR